MLHKDKDLDKFIFLEYLAAKTHLVNQFLSMK